MKRLYLGFLTLFAIPLHTITTPISKANDPNSLANESQNIIENNKHICSKVIDSVKEQPFKFVGTVVLGANIACIPSMGLGILLCNNNEECIRVFANLGALVGIVWSSKYMYTQGQQKRKERLNHEAEEKLKNIK
ncbi:MAG TPA: hypothetical protein VGW78_00800 [Candidatus Babeliales bacterium]|jgi:hypothetical protein|nr:hypothetical protein [Candidatus Babeliales bacterium]